MINTSRNWSTKRLWVAIFIYFILTLIISLSYHWGHIGALTDLGSFDQAVWGTLNGDFFLNTNTFSKQISYLCIHFRPVLLIFLPFYALLPKVEWMILGQSFALSLTAWPIYLLARQVTKSESVAFFWALAYMLNPFIISVLPWIFRPESLAVPFIAIAFLAIEKSNFCLLLLSCFLVVLCKEHFGIMVIGFGFLWGIRNKRWKQASVLVLFGAIYSYIVLGVIMPALSPTGEHIMLTKGIVHGRYTWLGSSTGEAIQTIFNRPFYVLKKVIFEMNGVGYLFIIFTMILGLPLAAPEFLLPGFVDLACNMLSAVNMPRSPFAYHSATLVPVLIVAAIYGTERISRKSRKYLAKKLSCLVFIVSLILCYFHAPLPIPFAYNFWKPVHLLNLPDSNVSTIRSLLGKESSVSTQSNIGAHFSQRREIYRYPNKVGEVDYIILRLSSPTNNIDNFPNQRKNERQYLIRSLDWNLQMDRTEYIESIENLLSGTEYSVFYWNNPWLVMKRGELNKRPSQVSEIKLKLNQLCKEWKIKNGE